MDPLEEAQARRDQERATADAAREAETRAREIAAPQDAILVQLFETFASRMPVSSAIPFYREFSTEVTEKVGLFGRREETRRVTQKEDVARGWIKSSRVLWCSS